MNRFTVRVAIVLHELARLPAAAFILVASECAFWGQALDAKLGQRLETLRSLRDEEADR